MVSCRKMFKIQPIEDKTGSTAYASVHVTEMNYPSASIKYRTHVADKGFTAEYTEQRGLGTCTVIYNKNGKKRMKM